MNNKRATNNKGRPVSFTTVTLDDRPDNNRRPPGADYNDDDDLDDVDPQPTIPPLELNNNNSKPIAKDNNNSNKASNNKSKKTKLPPIVVPPNRAAENANYDARKVNDIQDIALPTQRPLKQISDTRTLRERIKTLRDRFSDVSDSLKCGICGNIFLDPVQIVHVDCNHIYCERCLEVRIVDESDCPECGFRFSQNLVKPASAINNIILDQLVPCFYEPAGCQEKIRFRELDDHEKRCLYNPDRDVECICGQEMPLSKHQDHLVTVCPDYSFDCPHGCGEKVKRKLLQRHEDFDCALKPVRCEFAKFGCPFKGPRADLHKHNKATFQNHMAMMAGRIQDLEAETKKMHIVQREQHQRRADDDQEREARKGDSLHRSYEGLLPIDPKTSFHKKTLNSLGLDSRVKPNSKDGEASALMMGGGFEPSGVMRSYDPSAADVMFGGSSDRVMPAGLSRMNELVRPKWDRLSQPKRIIESPRDNTYRFVRPFSVAFVNNETLVMADCKTVWLIDVETGAVRNTLDPLTLKERQLYRPRGVAVQELGLRVFVCDSQADCVHVFSPWGEYSTSFGKGKLKYPMGITTYRNRIYVCDTHHNTMQIFDTVGTHCGNLVDDYHGSPMQACSSETTGLIYVTMNSTSDSYVLVVDYMGEFVTTFGYKGHDIGMLQQARGVIVDQNENVFVSNSNQYKIQMFGKIPTKISLRETRRWENKVREQIWHEEVGGSKSARGGGDGGDGDQTTTAAEQQDNNNRMAGGEQDFEKKVQERMKNRPTEMALPKFEYRVVNWLGGDLSAPCGLALSPNRAMLAVVDEIKNKLYIY